MVAQRKLSDVIVEIYEEQEDAFVYPISSQKEARAFVKALHSKGIDYNEMCEAIGEFEHNFCSWRKGLGRQGIGQAIISLINEPFKDLLLSDEESEEEEEEEEPVILRQDIIKSEDKLRPLSRVEQLKGEAAKIAALSADSSSDDATDSTDESTNLSDFSSRDSSVEKWLDEKSEDVAKDEKKGELAKKEEDIITKKVESKEEKFVKEVKNHEKEIVAKEEEKKEEVKEIKKEEITEKKQEVVKEKKKAEFGKKDDSVPTVKREKVCVKIEKEEVKEEKKVEKREEEKEKEDEKSSNGPFRDDISSDSSSVVEAEITEGYDSDLDPEGVDPNSDKAALLRQVTALKTDMETNDAGFLYIFTDSSKFASRPRLKIGCSRFPQKRLEQAMKFNIDIRMVFCVEVTQRKSALESVCMQLKPYRLEAQDDWFKAAQDKAIRVVTETAKIFTDKEENDEDSESAC
ncbi:hypothetical protein CAPTEDRAFT_219804 [Capitella teleta]|uniref:Uncharacterized protein n=1 Tax=Capitella teleta TaxID=283909 RepID=R7TK12_CAPTE|nr:hypothetical protein CAPTEDRAFT_219804 [Capitella teleta]|eukprot:ELT91866.1 hypothetical protein CAPTEDRAFT_219804 [Capitella teleta]